MTFTATEFDRATSRPTGRTETYQADTLAGAVGACLHTRQLSDRTAHQGPTGRVIYAGRRCYLLKQIAMSSHSSS